MELEQAVEQCQEALRALREADKHLGWELAMYKLDEGNLRTCVTCGTDTGVELGLTGEAHRCR